MGLSCFTALIYSLSPWLVRVWGKWLKSTCGSAAMAKMSARQHIATQGRQQLAANSMIDG